MAHETRPGVGEPQVAVVIPYYNGSKFIERSTKSVLEQTVKCAEFIIVNDGSSLEESEFLRQFADRQGIRILEKENGGQGSARNAGVAATTAEYICFLDQDDFFLKTHIEILTRALPDNDPHFGWVYGDLIEADGNGDVIRYSMVKDHSAHPKTNIYQCIGSDMFVLPSASLIAREAFEAVGGFDTQFMGYEDDDLFIRLFRKGFTNHFVDRPVTVWCINTDSTSYSIRMSRSRMRFFKKLAETFPDDGPKARFYMRDIHIPRFHKSIVGEVINAFSGDIPERDDRLHQHREELLSIMKEYMDIVDANAYVPAGFKKRLRAQYRLLSTGSRPLIILSRKLLNAARRTRSMMRR